MTRYRRSPSRIQHTGPARREGPDRCFGAHAIRARGFTLTESMIASVVLAACVVGIGGTLGASYKNSTRLDENGVATALARQMLEEILSRRYTDGAGATDSIYDYREGGYTWPAASGFTTIDGAPVADPGGGTYTRSSAVHYYDNISDLEGEPEASVSGSSPPPVALVTVTVTTPGGKAITLTQLVVQR